MENCTAMLVGKFVFHFKFSLSLSIYIYMYICIYIYICMYVCISHREALVDLDRLKYARWKIHPVNWVKLRIPRVSFSTDRFFISSFFYIHLFHLRLTENCIIKNEFLCVVCYRDMAPVCFVFLFLQVEISSSLDRKNFTIALSSRYYERYLK